MSSKKSKRPQDNSTTNPDEKCRYPESTNRHVYIEPEVKIDFVENLREQYKSAQGDQATQNDKQLFWTKIGAGLIFIYALITFWQACITREALVSVQRAYIFTDSADINPIADESGKTIAAMLPVTFRNSGSTPTRKMKAHLNWTSQAETLPKDFPFPDLASPGSADAPMAIGPKGFTNLTAGPIDIAILENVRLHKLHLYLWGWARYHDIFDKTSTRLTEFCYDVSVMQGLQVTQPLPAKSLTVQYTSCETHNCYDEECQDYSEMTK